MVKDRIQLFIDKKINEKMRQIIIRKKGDISKYIEDLIKKDLEIKGK